MLVATRWSNHAGKRHPPRATPSAQRSTRSRVTARSSSSPTFSASGVRRTRNGDFSLDAQLDALDAMGFLQTSVTNAGTEAMNRSVKAAARTAYGFRNLDNQRRRVRFACTRRSRRATAC
jgi:hypothetical protein